MNDNASLKIWQTLQPMVRKEVAKGTESSVKSKKMVVTTAFNTATKTVGVKEAFGKEIQVPVAGTINPSSLTVGTAVWVVALHGSWSNAMVWMRGDGETGYQYLNATDTAYNSERVGGKTVSDLMLMMYPVGSVYISVNNVSPAQLFGGTWEQIEDTFLLAAGNTYAAGTTGGEATHTLTVDEMPSHNHNLGVKTASVASGSNYSRLDSSFTSASDDVIADTGGGQAHNNMPPYLAVYMWKRVPDPVVVTVDGNGNATISGTDIVVDANGNATTTAQMTVDENGNAMLG